MSIFHLLSGSVPGGFFINEIKERAAIAIHPSGDYIYAASGNT